MTKENDIDKNLNDIINKSFKAGMVAGATIIREKTISDYPGGEERKIYYKALKKWGNEAQIRLAVEKCAEFIVSKAKHDRAINGSSTDDIREEITDVIIMMEQMYIIFGEEEISKIKKKKLERLKKLIEGE